MSRSILVRLFFKSLVGGLQVYVIWEHCLPLNWQSGAMLLKLLILGLVIGSNNLAVSLALGAHGQAKYRWRAVLVFGVFEFFVPLIGMWLGQNLAGTIESYTGWIGAVLLLSLGLWTLVSALRDSSEGEKIAERVTTWSGLIFLESWLCLDNLVVGFSLGLKTIEPLALASTIATFSMFYTWAGMKLGNKARKHWEQYAKAMAGMVLVCLAGATWVDWI